jgi:hypothetical protein
MGGGAPPLAVVKPDDPAWTGAGVVKRFTVVAWAEGDIGGGALTAAVAKPDLVGLG